MPELGDGEPSPQAKSFIDLRREFADQEWIPSCYMDDGRGGLLLKNNTIVLGVGAGFNYEAVKKMATEHNGNLRSGAAQEVSPSANFVSEIRPRPDDPSCHVCGARMAVTEWKCLSCKATTGVEEVSPPSPALGNMNIGLHKLATEPHLIRLKEDREALDKLRAGDTRELKAALAELYEAASNEQYVDQLSIALEKAEKLL
jgi:hypothetical protein